MLHEGQDGGPGLLSRPPDAKGVQLGFREQRLRRISEPLLPVGKDTLTWLFTDGEELWLGPGMLTPEVLSQVDFVRSYLPAADAAELEVARPGAESQVAIEVKERLMHGRFHKWPLFFLNYKNLSMAPFYNILAKFTYTFEFSRQLFLKIALCDRFYRKKGATTGKKGATPA